MNCKNSIPLIFLLIIIMFVLFIKTNIEPYDDTYSIELHAQAINRMRRRNMMHSWPYSGLNWKKYDYEYGMY